MVSIKSASVAQDKKIFFDAAERVKADIQTMVDCIKHARADGRDTSWVPSHWWHIIRPMVEDRCTVSTWLMCAGNAKVALAIDALSVEHRSSVLAGCLVKVYDPKAKTLSDDGLRSIFMKPEAISDEQVRRVFVNGRVRTLQEQKRLYDEREAHPERDDQLSIEGSPRVKNGTLYVRTNAGTVALALTKPFVKMVVDGAKKGG